MATKKFSMAEIRRRVQHESAESSDDVVKTAMMYRLERKYKKDIRWLLNPDRGSGRTLAIKYAVTESAISIWRKKLGIVVENSSHYEKGHYPTRWL